MPCDTFVCLRDTTTDGAVIFGKNSDRSPNEAQGLLSVSARRWFDDSDAKPATLPLKCTYITIDQVASTHACVLSKPGWIWGCEMGANEHGVSIGNQALFSRVPTEDKALLGMDLVRLGLERYVIRRQSADVTFTDS